ncbi:glycosyltransferase family 2 protein [Paludisphaera sp. Pla2]|uniref:Glycosyltransferase family 2 protein n=2 Tax=Paludisphaera mucosa TaxID=3030827 RepID=A0ABT6FER0_9BACT|nr:glycosyltransferase family 2 protein [Paludisphaera mucosa]MDG3005860.1 glycosyltransferase family 2 protein [Paludisphaera mucosa]
MHPASAVASSKKSHRAHTRPDRSDATPGPAEQHESFDVEQTVGGRKSAQIDLSFVIPLMDEQATLVELYQRIASEMPETTRFEVIFIDDGSSDDSWGTIKSLAEREPNTVRGLRFRRNAGKASALTAGFRAARGGIVFTLDADLQDDPKEIGRFLEKLDEGYDLISGWKKTRHDPWHKVLPSRLFNLMLSHVSRVRLHDHNCGFKCYRAGVVKGLTLHGEMHRMVPALAAIEGFRAAEIVVEHHPRRHGVSKYGFERYLRGFMDMMTVGFLRKYRERPSHFIGGVSAVCACSAVSLIVAGFVLALTKLPLAASVAVLSGVVMLATAIVGSFCGLLAELAIRGGLWAHWKLPIVEDTTNDRASTSSEHPPLPAVQLAYHCHRSGGQLTQAADGA